jgi:2-isopropylmalate synthase
MRSCRLPKWTCGTNNRLASLGVKLEPQELDEIYQKFLEMADKKKNINDDDILMLVGKDARLDRIKVEYLQVLCGIGVRDVASIALNIAGERFEATASGNGPVDADIRAVEEHYPPEVKFGNSLFRQSTMVVMT